MWGTNKFSLLSATASSWGCNRWDRRGWWHQFSIAWREWDDMMTYRKRFYSSISTMILPPVSVLIVNGILIFLFGMEELQRHRVDNAIHVVGGASISLTFAGGGLLHNAHSSFRKYPCTGGDDWWEGVRTDSSRRYWLKLSDRLFGGSVAQHCWGHLPYYVRAVDENREHKQMHNKTELDRPF